MHNAVYPLSEEIRSIEPRKNKGEKVVTYLGRITMQKGPEYFIEAAKRVLDRTHNIRFCFAGSGDMLNAMIELAATYGIADRCHFPGFQRGKQVYESPKLSDIAGSAQSELNTFWEEYKRLNNPQRYKVDLSQRLYDLKTGLLAQRAR